MSDRAEADRQRFFEMHATFPRALDTFSLLEQMRQHMQDTGVDSFGETIAAAKQELDRMPEARARALGPRFWTKRLVSLANRALRAAGKGERWTRVRLAGDGEGPDPTWLLATQAGAKELEALGLGRRVRPVLRLVSLPFLLFAVGLGVVAYRHQTIGTVVLALAGYLLWFAATQVAARVSSGRSWR